MCTATAHRALLWCDASATKNAGRCSNTGKAIFQYRRQHVQGVFVQGPGEGRCDRARLYRVSNWLAGFSYFQELVSERRVAVKRMGMTVFRWEKAEKQANEALDTFVYSSAAAIKHGVNWISDLGWQKLRAELETPMPKHDGKPRVFRTAGSDESALAR